MATEAFIFRPKTQHSGSVDPLNNYIRTKFGDREADIFMTHVTANLSPPHPVACIPACKPDGRIDWDKVRIVVKGDVAEVLLEGSWFQGLKRIGNYLAGRLLI